MLSTGKIIGFDIEKIEMKKWSSKGITYITLNDILESV